MRRVLIEIQPRSAKGQIQIDQYRAGHHRFRQGVGDIVGEDRRPHSALGPDKGHHPTDERGFWIGEQIGDRLNDLTDLEGRDQIVRNAAPDQFAIEADIVSQSDDHHLGVGIADLR